MSLSQADPASSWSGKQGYVEQAVLERRLPDIKALVYYRDGPPELVAAMKAMLNKAGIDEAQVRSEEFARY